MIREEGYDGVDGVCNFQLGVAMCVDVRGMVGGPRCRCKGRIVWPHTVGL